MTQPSPAPTRDFASDGPPSPAVPPSGEGWFRTPDGRRYGWEIGFIIIVKVALLFLLWFVLIKPWPRPSTAPGAVAQHVYSQSAPASPHD